MKRALSLLVILLCVWALGSCQEKSKKATLIATGADSLPENDRKITEEIKARPDNPDLYIERAKIYLEKQDGTKAYDDAKKAVSLKPGEPKYYLTFSDACLMTGKLAECRAALDKSISLDKSWEAYLKMAELNLYLRDYPKVFQYAKQSLEVEALNPKAYFVMGFAYKEKGDTAAAIKSFKQTIDADQKFFDAYIQLGLIYAVHKNKLAADYYKAALQVRSNSIEALYNMGIFYQETEAYNEAMDSYRKIITINPKYKFAHYNLGYIHMFYLRVYRQAVVHFTDAINCDPRYVEAYYNRGYCYELMGDVMNAKQDYTKALELRPGYQLPLEGMKRLELIQNQH
jgi:tetratricopeptide (TPR) repeat protein